MKLAPTRQVAVFYDPRDGHAQRVGRLALKKHLILFEYDAQFLRTKLELSPYKLRLQRGVTEGNPTALDGLMGVFDDSLPDGWGRLLIDRRAAQLGISAATLTPLDRLALVGHRAMGALRFEPEVEVDEPTIATLSELARDAEAVQLDADDADLERLIAVGGSPKGARPKVLIQLTPGGHIHFGAREQVRGATAWLVKFPALSDPKGSAAAEHAYAEMARAAKIEMPATQLLRRGKNREAYFAIQRFDRVGPERIHMHTLGGLLHLPRVYPALEYADVLKVTRELTKDETTVVEMYRRACFNVLAHNRDDHSRNFAFLMSARGEWKLAPAYDLTFSDGPYGEHTTLVSGEGKAPTVDHLLRLAETADVRRASAVLEDVQRAIAQFRDFAAAAGVPAPLRDQIANRIIPAKAKPVAKKRRVLD